MNCKFVHMLRRADKIVQAKSLILVVYHSLSPHHPFFTLVRKHPTTPCYEFIQILCVAKTIRVDQVPAPWGRLRLPPGTQVGLAARTCYTQYHREGSQTATRTKDAARETEPRPVICPLKKTQRRDCDERTAIERSPGSLGARNALVAWFLLVVAKPSGQAFSPGWTMRGPLAAPPALGRAAEPASCERLRPPWLSRAPPLRCGRLRTSAPSTA